jgi:uncharacterized membrane protein
MIQDYIPVRIRGEAHFRWRGGEVSRIEALSDIVFAMVLTLVVLTEVPHTLDQLFNSVWHLPSIAICWALLFWFWYLHYLFHRRFGFEDVFTMVWNSVLLCVILLYAFPLKFMFLMLTYQAGWFFGADLPAEGIEMITSMENHHGGLLMLSYAIAVGLIFSLFALLNRHGLKRRVELELTEAEVQQVRASVQANMICVCIALLAGGIVLVNPEFTPIAGCSLGLIGPALAVHEFRAEKKLQRILGN